MDKRYFKVYPMIDRAETAKRIDELIKKSNLSIKEIKDSLYLSAEQSIYAWLSGRNIPTTANLYALSKTLGVPMDEIIRGNMDAVDE